MRNLFSSSWLVLGTQRLKTTGLTTRIVVPVLIAVLLSTLVVSTTSVDRSAEIAGELVISVRTVERHISNVYGKTGSSGRADATAVAFTRGLMTVHAATE